MKEAESKDVRPERETGLMARIALDDQEAKEIDRSVETADVRFFSVP